MTSHIATTEHRRDLLMESKFQLPPDLQAPSNPLLLVSSPLQVVLMDKVLSRKLQAGSPPSRLTSGIHGNGPLSSPLSKKVHLECTAAQSPFLSLFSFLSCLRPDCLFPHQSLHSSHSRGYMEATLKLLSLDLKKERIASCSPLWREYTSTLAAASKGIFIPWLFISALFEGCRW